MQNFSTKWLSLLCDVDWYTDCLKVVPDPEKLVVSVVLDLGGF